MLILTEYIAKHELKPLMRHFRLEDILEGARKILKNLAVPIKSLAKDGSYRFFKVRIGKKGSGRMIAFLVTYNNKIVPFLIRLKKDKVFGMNMAMNNPEVIAELKKNFDRVINDVQDGKFEEFSLE